jgi:hypothetical protein
MLPIVMVTNPMVILTQVETVNHHALHQVAHDERA